MGAEVTMGLTFGEWFLAAREAAGFATNEAFAADAGVGPNQVSEWVAGRRTPGKRNIAKLARTLRVPAGELMARLYGEQAGANGAGDFFATFERQVRDDPVAMAQIAGLDGDENEIVARMALELMKAALRTGGSLGGRLGPA